jgi:acylpyruvate hydrolase
MRLVSFQRYRYRSLGALSTDGRIVDLAAAAAAWLCLEQDDPFWEREVALRLPADVGQFLAGGQPSNELARAAIAFACREPANSGIGGEPLLVSSRDVRLLRPLFAPLVLSSGATFRDERDRNGRERQGHREFFMRNPLNLLGPSDDIALPTWLGEEFDVAARLAVVIGERLRCASRAQADAAIFGYCAALEVCARSLESISWAGPMFHVQYPHARAFDGSLLLGASVVSKDEVGRITDKTARVTIGTSCLFDGRVAGRWDELLDWICYLSEAVTLEPGTLLIPGSADETAVQPECSGNFPAELVQPKSLQRALLRPGADVAVDIDGVGTIATRVIVVDHGAGGNLLRQ